jgi:hypothetical protein|tara:strand:+ start:237 stop:398 length:162 start_codon:yes stop_codon:yes gene_type:complete
MITKECFACGVKFKVSFEEEEEAELNYCPHCGTEDFEELQFEEDPDFGDWDED